MRERAARCDDSRSDEGRDDRYRQGFEIARGGRGKAPAHVQSERQRPREVGRHGRADDREPDHFRTKTASPGASAPAVITATVDAPASASTPATAAATTATAMSTGRLTARTTIPTNVAVIAKSTPQRRGSPIVLPRAMPASGDQVHRTKSAPPQGAEDT